MSMNKIPYSNSAKTIMHLLHGLVSILFVISVFMIAFLFKDNAFHIEDTGRGTYEDSQFFVDRFRNSSSNVEKFIKLKYLLETNGKFSGKNFVDVVHYKDVKNGMHTMIERDSEPYQFLYTLETIEDWSEAGVQEIYYAYNIQLQKREDGIYQSGSLVVDGEKFDLDEKKVTDYGQLHIELSEKIAVLLENQGSDIAMELNPEEPIDIILNELNMDMVTCRSRAKLLKEIYSPSAGKTIGEYVKSGEMPISVALKISDKLIALIGEMPADIKEYKRLKNIYTGEESNYKYWIYNKENKVIDSNIDNIDKNNVEEYGRRLGKYIYWNSADGVYSSNIKNIDKYFYDDTEQLSNFGNNIELLLAVNTKYDHKDTFYSAHDDYEKLRPWLRISIVLIAVCSVIWLICMLFLTAAAGRRENTDQIYLSFIDKLKTEFILAELILAIAFTIYSYVRLAFGKMWYIPSVFIIAGTLAFIGHSMIMIGYFSIVRRIKSRTMWSGSILYMLINSIKRCFEDSRLSVRLFIVYAIHCIVILTCSYMAFGENKFIAFIVLIVVMLVEGSYYVKAIRQKKQIVDGVERITEGDLDYKIDTTDYYEMNKQLGEGINCIGDGLQNAVDASMKNERMKADLITNVSHDIKTPLTSIINYANLIKLEDIQNDRVASYVNILVDKSQRLKQLTEDLVEASKISSGNITLNMTQIDLVELIYQTGGEFNEKFEVKELTTITHLPKEPVIIMADGRRIWRVIENLYNNVAKYALEKTRVYVDLEVIDGEAHFSIRNISEQVIKVRSDELTARFIRGDESRTTEGSGLGLSIAKNLTVLMGGHLELTVDGDLFIAKIIFPLSD